MLLCENPFSILKASTRDRKARLNELSDEAALHGDHDLAINARNILSNPRTRLTAEVAWFPGLSPKRIAHALDQIEQGRSPSLDGLSPLISANLLVETLKNYTKRGSEDLKFGIEALVKCVEIIDQTDVLQAINEDRQAAGIPYISDPGLIESEISDRMKHYERSATALLEDLPSDEMVAVYEYLISKSTNNGTDVGHRLIDELIHSYELKTESFLANESIRIQQLIELSKVAADKKASEMQVRAGVNEIITALRTWDKVAQPIQIAYKSRGLTHDESHNLAFSARGLGIHLFNKHDYLEDAKLMSEAIQELFSEISAVSDQVVADIEALDDIAIERIERKNSEAASKDEFAREITYETKFGVIFKDKFRISPAGFDYKGSLIPLDQIVAVRWGAVRNSRNGIHTGTDYYFSYATKIASVVELTPDKQQYQEIIQKAWRAVCIRILLGWMEEWGKGKKVSIAGAEVSDDGLVLKKTHFFKSDEIKFFPWSELSKTTNNGNLIFYGTTDRKFTISFSYKDGWNIHIFDFAIDKIWEGKAGKLSEIFGN